MTNKYENLRLEVILSRISDKNILTKAADIIGRMRENKDCIDYIYIPVDCVDDMDYVITAINYIIGPFGYKAFWDCLNYVEVGGKYCIHLYLDELW